MFKKTAVISIIVLLALVCIIWSLNKYIMPRLSHENQFNLLNEPQKINWSEVTPISPPENYITFWLHAEDLNQLPDGAVVSDWLDKGPKKVVMRSLASAKDPILRKKALNNYSSVLFSDNAFLEGWSIVGTDFLSNENISVFLVYKPSQKTVAPNVEDVFGWGDCNTQRFLLHLHGYILYMFHFGDPRHHIESHLLQTSDDKFHIVVLNKTSKEATIEINGATAALAKIPNTLDLNQTSTISVGTSACGNSFQGEITELLFAKDLPVSKRHGVTLYLSKKYNLPLN